MNVLVDAQLDHWPIVRIPVTVPDELQGDALADARGKLIVADAKAEYFRLYGIERSHNAFVAEVVDGATPPADEPGNWVAIRKQIGTLGTERKVASAQAPPAAASTAAPEPAKTADQTATQPAASPSVAPPPKA